MCPPIQSRTYIPPEDLQSRLESHVKEVFGSSVPSNWQDISLEDVHLKFSFLARLANDLRHAVPNSRLHQMCRVRDVLDFYNVPVQDRSKFDELIASNLPHNLKITWGYWTVQKRNTLKAFSSPWEGGCLSDFLILYHLKCYQNCSLNPLFLWKNVLCLFFFVIMNWYITGFSFFIFAETFVFL